MDMSDPYRRATRFIGTIDETTRVLEIGALHRPTLSKDKYNIKYADFTDAETLKVLYKDSGYPLDDFVKVDCIIKDGDYISVIGSERFDLILASHVGEHMPDFIGWIHEMYSILSEGGVLSLILPDKRFTFDLIRDPTTVADLLTAYKAKLKRPSFQQIYDSVRTHTSLDGADLWQIGSEALTLRRTHTESEAWDIIRNVFLSDVYYDAHCSILTPISFFESICKLEELDLFPFEIESFYDSHPGDIDFQVRFKKSMKGGRVSAREFPAVLNGRPLYNYEVDGETVTVVRT